PTHRLLKTTFLQLLCEFGLSRKKRVLHRIVLVGATVLINLIGIAHNIASEGYHLFVSQLPTRLEHLPGRFKVDRWCGLCLRCSLGLLGATHRLPTSSQREKAKSKNRPQ